MRRFLAFLSVALMLAAALPLAGCTGCGGLPTVTLRSPVQLDSETPTVAAPRLMQMPPRFAVPSWQEAPGACSPGYPGVTYYTPGPAPAPGAGAPCNPGAPRPPQ